MKIYLAGFPAMRRMITLGLIEDYSVAKRVLVSFHGLKRKFMVENADLIRKSGLKIFLDSGAFSAMTQGVQVDLDDYISFIKEFGDLLELYAGLDVIGDAEGTWKNQEYMEKHGLNPLWCFHTNEDFNYLDRGLKRYQYIACGGMKGVGQWGNSRIKRWLLKVYNMAHKEKVRIHGFALTGFNFLQDFHFLYSVDSLGWKFKAAIGEVLIGHDVLSETAPIWAGIPNIIPLTERRRYDVAGIGSKEEDEGPGGKAFVQSSRKCYCHFDLFTRENQDRIVGYFSEMGRKYFGDPDKFYVENLKEDSELRALLNIIWYREYEERLSKKKKVRRLI